MSESFITALVTGAGKGIGLGLVRRLLERGERVIATARSAKDLAILDQVGAQHPKKLRTFSLDVTRESEVEALRKALAGEALDLLINNAGVGAWEGLDGLERDKALRMFDVNALGPLRMTSALLPSLRLGRGKVVLHITSRMGSIEDNASGGSYAYRMSKAALNMASRSLSIDLRSDGIASVAVHPGWVKTDMGGPGAPVTVEESVDGLLKVAEKAHLLTGKFVDFHGDELPW